MTLLRPLLVLLLLLVALAGCAQQGATPGGSGAEPSPTTAADGGEAAPSPTTAPQEESAEPSPTVAGEASGPEIPENLDDLIIHMERAPCFGTCPVYEVTIDGSGHVEFIGHRFVEVEGVQEAQLSEEQLRELVAAFYEAGFFEMRDRYEGQVTDLPSTTTTITIGGVTKSVYNYFQAPEELIELEETIDRISGATEWIGQR